MLTRWTGLASLIDKWLSWWKEYRSQYVIGPPSYGRVWSSRDPSTCRARTETDVLKVTGYLVGSYFRKREYPRQLIRRLIRVCQSDRNRHSCHHSCRGLRWYDKIMCYPRKRRCRTVSDIPYTQHQYPKPVVRRPKQSFPHDIYFTYDYLRSTATDTFLTYTRRYEPVCPRNLPPRFYRPFDNTTKQSWVVEIICEALWFVSRSFRVVSLSEYKSFWTSSVGGTVLENLS